MRGRRRLHPTAMNNATSHPREGERASLQRHIPPAQLSEGEMWLLQGMIEYLLHWCKPCRGTSRRFRAPRSIRCRRGGNPAAPSSSLCLLGTRSPGPRPGCWDSPGALASPAEQESRGWERAAEGRNKGRGKSRREGKSAENSGVNL